MSVLQHERRNEMSPGHSRSAVWGLESSPSPVLITLHRLCRAGPQGWRWFIWGHPGTVTSWGFSPSKQKAQLVQVHRCILGVFKGCGWTKKFWERLWRGVWYSRECCSWRWCHGREGDCIVLQHPGLLSSQLPGGSGSTDTADVGWGCRKNSPLLLH